MNRDDRHSIELPVWIALASFAGVPMAQGACGAGSGWFFDDAILGSPGDQLGDQVEIADVDADGSLDLIYSAPGANKVVIDLAGGGEIVLEPPSPEVGWSFGRSIAVGYIDSDVYPDIVVGAPGETGGGCVYLFLSPGDDSPPPQSPLKACAGFGIGSLGSAVAILDDLNADGFRDYAAGAPGGFGAVLLFSGATGQRFTGPVPPSMVSPPASGFLFGATLEALDATPGNDGLAGDRNDLAIGFTEPLGTAPHVRIWGGPTFSGPAPGTLRADLMDNIGDLDGDGSDELAWTEHDTSSGKDFVGIWSAWTQIIDPAIELDRRATAVAGVGDVDGDSFPDVLVADDEGLLQLFAGEAPGSSKLGAVIMRLDPNAVVKAVRGDDLDGDGWPEIVMSHIGQEMVRTLHFGRDLGTGQAGDPPDEQSLSWLSAMPTSALPAECPATEIEAGSDAFFTFFLDAGSEAAGMLSLVLISNGLCQPPHCWPFPDGSYHPLNFSSPVWKTSLANPFAIVVNNLEPLDSNGRGVLRGQFPASVSGTLPAGTTFYFAALVLNVSTPTLASNAVAVPLVE